VNVTIRKQRSWLQSSKTSGESCESNINNVCVSDRETVCVCVFLCVCVNVCVRLLRKEKRWNEKVVTFREENSSRKKFSWENLVESDFSLIFRKMALHLSKQTWFGRMSLTSSRLCYFRGKNVSIGLFWHALADMNILHHIKFWE